jgi:hypothetical protein
MAYDETTFRRPDDGADDPAAYRANTMGAPDYRGRRRDLDPADGGGARVADVPIDPLRRTYDDYGRDRIGIHIGWEIILLLAVAAIAFLLYRLDPDSLKRPALDTLLISATSIGLLAMGAGLSMRAAVPNLAVGPIALAAAVHFAENGDKGLLKAAAPALIVAAVGGLVVAVFVIALHVPGWAASLAAALGLITWIQLRTGPVTVQGDYNPSNQAFYLFGGFAVLAVVGGALGSVQPIRRTLGRMRPTGDPSVRRGAAAAGPVILALVLSSMFAVAAGILMAAKPTRAVVPTTGLQWTGVAFGVALLAGTSAFGRRGGIFGTLLAATGIALFLDYSARRDLDIALFAIGACTIGAGLIVTRLVETYGKPLSAATVDEDWNGAPSAGVTNWQQEPPDTPPDTWTPPSVPAQRSDRWHDGPWAGSR